MHPAPPRRGCTATRAGASAAIATTTITTGTRTGRSVVRS